MAGPTTPGRVDLVAYRWSVFTEVIEVVGADLSNLNLRAEIRAYRDQPGPPVFGLANDGPTAQGLSVTVLFDDDGVPTSTIQIRINETTIENALPFPGSGLEPGASVELVWDMLIYGAGFPKARWFEGSFTIIPGATQV